MSKAKEQRKAHKQIRVSQEVFDAIQSEAVALVDTPDTVLRRKFKVTNEKENNVEEKEEENES